MSWLQTEIINGIFFLFGEIDFKVLETEKIILDIVVSGFFIFLILTFIRKIQALHIFFISLILGILLFISRTYDLYATEFILKIILILLAVSIPLMFPPEIRRTLEKFGSISFKFLRKNTKGKYHSLIKILKQSSEFLAEKKHGALIVIEQSISLDTYAQTGIELDTRISKDIIFSIFYPKSPLHDGAILIREDRIICAGAVLPLSMDNLNQRGTRHKSALGISEMTDAITIVISEEQGTISLAHNKQLLKNVSPDFLENYLEEHLF